MRYCPTWAAPKKKGRPKKNVRKLGISDHIKQGGAKRRRKKKNVPQTVIQEENKDYACVGTGTKERGYKGRHRRECVGVSRHRECVGVSHLGLVNSSRIFNSICLQSGNVTRSLFSLTAVAVSTGAFFKFVNLS